MRSTRVKQNKNLYCAYLNITTHHFGNSMNFIHIHIAQSFIDIVSLYFASLSRLLMGFPFSLSLLWILTHFTPNLLFNIVVLIVLSFIIPITSFNGRNISLFLHISARHHMGLLSHGILHFLSSSDQHQQHEQV
jgi:hypothetical protein